MEQIVIPAETKSLKPQKFELALIFCLLCFCCYLYFGQLGARALWSEELRWAQIPKEMMQSGEYFSPTINGQSYYDKPLGSYWLIVLTSLITGVINEISCRIPCAISGVFSVFLTMLIARIFYPAKTTIYAGLILATSYSFVFFSRHASTDMENIAGILLSLWIFLKYEKSPQGWWVVLFWLSMALTSLTKGLLGFALPLLVSISYATAANLHTLVKVKTMKEKVAYALVINQWFFQWRTLVAMPIGLFVYVVPFLISLVWDGNADGLTMVWRENIRRFYNPANHIGPIYLYLGVIFILLAPWSLLLPAAIIQAFSKCKNSKEESSPDLFALVYFISLFTFFTLASSRRSYYLLPVLPGAAILIASLLSQKLSSLNLWALGLFKIGCALFFVSVVMMLFLLIPAEKFLPQPYDSLPRAPHYLFLGWIIISTLLLAIRAILGNEMSGWFVCQSWFAAFLMIYIFQFFYPAAEEYRMQKEFIKQVKLLTEKKPNELALYKTREAVFYLDSETPLPEFQDEEKLWASYKKGLTRWVLMKKRDTQSRLFTGKIVLEEPCFLWEGKQTQVKLALVDLSQHQLDSELALKEKKD